MLIILFTFLFNCLVLAQLSLSNVEEYLNSYFTSYDKVEFQFINQVNWNDIVIDYSRPLIHKSDNVYLPVKAKGKDREFNTTIRLKVRLFKNVYKAKKDIQFNSSLSEENFNYELTDVTNVRGNFISNDVPLNLYKTKFTLKKGEILLRELVDEIPVIESGDKVTLEVQKGSVIISYHGIARQHGRIGETIDVLAGNNEILKAKVINKQKVIVE